MKKLFKTVYQFFKEKINSIEKIKSHINISNDSDNELNEKFLFDFKMGWRDTSWSNVPGGISVVSDVPVSVNGDENETKENKQYQVIKPIDVLDELERIVKPIDLSNIDQKIQILEYKRDVIKQHYTKRELSALIERLNNRKQYVKFRDFFEQFQNTDENKIGKLCQKYNLVMKESDIFVPEFPDDAILTMKEYTDNVQKITNKKPIFYVISNNEDFRDADGKRDPILLAQSPFGFYYQILGAWDKEMILLTEL